MPNMIGAITALAAANADRASIKARQADADQLRLINADLGYHRHWAPGSLVEVDRNGYPMPVQHHASKTCFYCGSTHSKYRCPNCGA